MAGGQPPTRAEDEALLNLLYLREFDGMGMKEIGERVGMSKNAVIGQINRVMKDMVPCECRKPENRDGGMPNRWWKKR